nr:immunoglobulin heavy chain junction region [Mus musculus]
CAKVDYYAMDYW